MKNIWDAFYDRIDDEYALVHVMDLCRRGDKLPPETMITNNDGLTQDCGNSITKALEIPRSCNELSIQGSGSNVL